MCFLSKACVCLSHVRLPRPSSDKLVSCFHLPAAVNKRQFKSALSLLYATGPAVPPRRHRRTLRRFCGYFPGERTCCFPWQHHCFAPPPDAPEFEFLCLLPTLAGAVPDICCPLAGNMKTCPSDARGRHRPAVFVCVSLQAGDERPFMHIGRLFIFFGHVFIPIFCLLFNRLCVFLLLSYKNSYIYSEYQSLFTKTNCKYFCPFCWSCSFMYESFKL